MNLSDGLDEDRLDRHSEDCLPGAAVRDCPETLQAERSESGNA
ncbi:hypothetical protein [Rubrobacter aplysinae]|nr:hypothetical protein [Rubrobacter aplysinae]